MYLISSQLLQVDGASSLQMQWQHNALKKYTLRASKELLEEWASVLHTIRVKGHPYSTCMSDNTHVTCPARTPKEKYVKIMFPMDTL